MMSSSAFSSASSSSSSCSSVGSQPAPRLTKSGNKVPIRREKHFCTFEGCPRFFTHKGHLNQHQRTHTNEKPYVCEWQDCSAAFGQSSHLKRHMYIHTGDLPFKCTFEGCSRAFTTKHTLRTHMNLHSRPCPYTCDFDGCGAAFHKKYQLRKHLCMHTGGKPHMCSAAGCSAGFDFPSKLKRHVASVHKGEAIHTCNRCDETFTKFFDLQAHVQQQHDGSTDGDGEDDDEGGHAHTFGHTCDVCGRAFRKANSLNQHKEIHNPARVLYPCPVQGCQSVFTHERNIASHVRAVHDKSRNHQCFQCGSTFAFATSLVRHEARCGMPVTRRKRDTPSLAEDITGNHDTRKRSRASRVLDSISTTASPSSSSSPLSAADAWPPSSSSSETTAASSLSSPTSYPPAPPTPLTSSVANPIEHAFMATAARPPTTSDIPAIFAPPPTMMSGFAMARSPSQSVSLDDYLDDTQRHTSLSFSHPENNFPSSFSSLPIDHTSSFPLPGQDHITLPHVLAMSHPFYHQDTPTALSSSAPPSSSSLWSAPPSLSGSAVAAAQAVVEASRAASAPSDVGYERLAENQTV